jgi:ammonium transporter, Amt family
VLAYLVTWQKYGRPDPSMSGNGLLAGLVAITAPCAYVTGPAAVLIGAVAGVLVVWAALFVENRLKLDDPVGAIAVHGFNGAWGLIALGLFADGTYGGGLNGGPEAGVAGLFYGDPKQLLAQVIGIVANVVWVGASSFALFKIIDLTLGMRVTPEQEVQGLDFNEVSAPAYSGDRPSINTPVFVTPRPANARATVGALKPAPAGGK